jgi:hypothetical protein
MKRKTKQKRPVWLIADRMPPLSSLLVPHVTDMRNGTFRPEVAVGDNDLGGIHFGRPVASIEQASRVAIEACKRGVKAAVEALSA